MGRGDRYQDRTFTVPMPGGARWPLGNERPTTMWYVECPHCHARAVESRRGIHPHTFNGDEGRPRKRVCFGKVGEV